MPIRHISSMQRFQSTCPARGTTAGLRRNEQAGGNFNPRAPRGARPVFYVARAGRVVISIHVPREGHDKRSIRAFRPPADFNPRAPRGARPTVSATEPDNPQFQSTCPARGTTGDGKHNDTADGISIHVPREGHDTLMLLPGCVNFTFQSTCPARGTTVNGHHIIKRQAISIHVPREGHDLNTRISARRTRNFNPRAPRGARLYSFHCYLQLFHVFQSTCPARGTTSVYHRRITVAIKFQSTCPARGTTLKMVILFW